MVQNRANYKQTERYDAIDTFKLMNLLLSYTDPVSNKTKICVVLVEQCGTAD